MLSPVYHVRVAHNAAVGLLAENFRQAHGRNNAAADDIRKNVAGADRRELVGIAHKKYAAI